MRSPRIGVVAAAAAAVAASLLSPSLVRAAVPTGRGQNLSATVASPRVLFGGIPLASPTPANAPFRDLGDNSIQIAPESLAPLGVTYIVDSEMGMVTLAGPDGTQTVTVAARRVAGEPGVFVPAVEVIEALGGKCEWHAASNTLYARAILTSAEMLGGQLRLKATLPILPTVRSDNGGRLVIVDVPGAEIGVLGKGLKLDAPHVKAARAGQFNDDTARIAIDLKEPGMFALLGDKPTLRVVLNPTQIAKTPQVSPATVPAPPTPAIAKAATAVAKNNAKKPAPLSVVKSVSFKRVSDDKAQFVVSADRAPALRAALSKGRLTLDLFNATLGKEAAALGGWDHPFLKTAQLVMNGDRAAQLILNLTRAVCFTIKPGSQGNLLLELTRPKSATGKLAGKTIVVDPGHGGSDSGARGINGTYEKNVNLAIGTQLAQQLQDAGANVILTRAGDTFMSVDARPVVANRAGADFFVSVHADSADRSSVPNGSTVYYHFDWASCRTLAQCIADRLADMGGIRSKGTHSDGRAWGGRFVNGYGVLRGSQMVAVLVECGYMTNRNDVTRLNSPEWQRKIAGAIANGLRDYVEGNPDADTRLINPQPDAGGIVIPALPPTGDGENPTDPTVPPSTLPDMPPPDDAP